jgi:hypothetical protein
MAPFLSESFNTEVANLESVANTSNTNLSSGPIDTKVLKLRFQNSFPDAFILPYMHGQLDNVPSRTCQIEKV